MLPSSLLARARCTAEEDAKASGLEQQLFGGSEEVFKRLGHVTSADENAEPEANKLHIPESKDLITVPAIASDVSRKVEVADKKPKKKRKAAWVDPDTEKVEINIQEAPRLRKLKDTAAEAVIQGGQYEERLREFHYKVNKRTSWSKRRTNVQLSDAETLSTAALTKQATALQRDLGVTASADHLQLTRMRDANIQERSKSVVQSVHWHPNAQLLLTGGLDKRLRLYNVDGVRNTCVQSVFLQDMPVANTCFTCGGNTVMAAGRRKYFYVWDVNAESLQRVPGIHGFDSNSLESFAAPPANVSEDAKACVAFLGNEGSVGIVSLLSRQLVGTVTMSGQVRCAAFNPSGVELYTAGTDGRVCVWDMRRQHRCVHSFVDEGCIRNTGLAVSGTQVASASASGIVNIHNRWRKDSVGGCTGKPLRALENLVTAVDTLQFSPDGSMLCMASKMQKDALRMVDIPSLSVYSNWPTSRTPLGHVHSVGFSPDGSMLAVGNAKGHVLTYKLHQ